MGSSTRSVSNNSPLGGVRVSVVQKPGVNDQTRDEDGVYTMKVPTSIKYFDLIYEKVGYLDAHDLNIPNNKDQQKRPIVHMTPDNPGILPPTVRKMFVTEAITDAVARIRRGKETNASTLVESRKKNLMILQRHVDPSTEEGRLLKKSFETIK